MNVAAVAVKLPDFWEEDPTTWFIEAESQFVLAHIVNDDTKYHHIVKNITKRTTINAVWDIISNPPAQNKYQTIKQRLLDVFSDTLKTRIDKLLSAQMGDSKPSQFLSYLRRLSADTGMNEDTIKQIWLKQMPSYISTVLTIVVRPLDEMAGMADAMVKCEFQANQVDKRDEKYDELKLEIENLSAAIRDMKPRNKPKYNQRSFPSKMSDNVCWFHTTYGRQARKCTPPCKFSKN